jgi:hypothetical protein
MEEYLQRENNRGMITKKIEVICIKANREVKDEKKDFRVFKILQTQTFFFF